MLWRAILCLWVTVAASSCEGEQVFIQAVPSADFRDFNGCHLVRWQVRSVRVQVIEFHGVENTETVATECVDVPAGTIIHDQWEMLEWFDDRGYIVRGVPVDMSTRIQLVGFRSTGCPNPADATVCAITAESLTGTTYEGGEVIPMWFVCACDLSCGPLEGETLRLWTLNTQYFDNCLHFESLDEFGG